jgi:predicted acylesterase/phospholipase RssA
MNEELRRKLEPDGKPKRILALDGGGARGLLTLGLLGKLEAELARRSPGGPNKFRLSQYFDLIGGTSTGSIIAVTLALGWPVRDIVDLYFKLLPAIFARPQAPGPLRIFVPGFKNTALTHALNDHLGDRMLNSDELKTGLAIHAKRIDSGSAWILVNNPKWKYFNSQADRHSVPNAEFYLRDLVQASAAAPTYFNDVRIGLERKKNGRIGSYGYFFDGGVSPNNNPALQLLLTATDPAFGFNWAVGEHNLLVWSLGTGYVRKRFEKNNPRHRSSAKTIDDFRHLMYSSKVQAALEGYNHDIGQQQITVLQTLSRPRFPWWVNGEIGDQTATPLLSAGAASLTYQRYDARIEIGEPDELRPEHIENLLGEQMKKAVVDRLREMDINDPALLDILYRTGEALAQARLITRDGERAPAIAPDWPPAHFDPEAWRAAPPPPSS